MAGAENQLATVPLNGETSKYPKNNLYDLVLTRHRALSTSNAPASIIFEEQHENVEEFQIKWVSFDIEAQAESFDISNTDNFRFEQSCSSIDLDFVAIPAHLYKKEIVSRSRSRYH